MTVGVLTAAPWHNSIGDLATSQVTLDYLAAAGIAARQVTSPDEDVDFLVIGGGELLRDRPGPAYAWFWDRFRPPGDHVLNACGIADGVDDDFAFLSDYRLVAVRDHTAARRVASVRPDVECVPCPATLVEPYEWDFARAVPGNEGFMQLEPGGYVVVHRHPLLAPLSRTIDGPVLVVDAQAWRRYPWKGAGTRLPPTHSVRLIQTYIAHAAAVVTYSLHLAVFAIGAGTPFVAIDFGTEQGEKIRRYLLRAGFEDAVMRVRNLARAHRLAASISKRVARSVGYSNVVDFAFERRDRLRDVSVAERARSQAHLERVTAACDR